MVEKNFMITLYFLMIIFLKGFTGYDFEQLTYDERIEEIYVHIN